MAYHGYEEVDHTADLALRVRGEDFAELLSQAANGFYHLMVVDLHPNSRLEKQFSIPQGTYETILVDFLSELLYLAEEDGIACESFSFEEREDEVLVSCVGKAIQSMARVFKAVTFHNLEVKQTPSGLEAIITFDV